MPDETIQTTAAADAQQQQQVGAARSWSWTKDVCIPVLIAIVALGGTWLGSYQATKTASDIQSKDFNEQRMKIDREKRADVYLKYLNAIDALLDEASKKASECMVEDSERVDIAAMPPGRIFYCNNRGLIAAIEPREDLRKDSNAVRMFGSDDAAQATKKVDETLTIHVWMYLKEEHQAGFSKSFDNDEAKKAKAAFEAIACREVLAIPRKSC